MKVQSRFRTKTINQTWNNDMENLKKTMYECDKKMMKRLEDSKLMLVFQNRVMYLTLILWKKKDKEWWRGCMGGS